jgi:hypothetical protein
MCRRPPCTTRLNRAIHYVHRSRWSPLATRPIRGRGFHCDDALSGRPLEMTTGTRNPQTRWVLPGIEAGVEAFCHPRVRYWTKSYTHRVYRVRVRLRSTHTRLPVGNLYPLIYIRKQCLDVGCQASTQLLKLPSGQVLKWASSRQPVKPIGASVLSGKNVCVCACTTGCGLRVKQTANPSWLARSPKTPSPNPRAAAASPISSDPVSSTHDGSRSG